jgi:ATP-dependent DNA helicase RecG
LEQYTEASRQDIQNLLLDKVSDVLTSDQKMNLITNLLQDMRKEEKIILSGSKKFGKWQKKSPISH